VRLVYALEWSELIVEDFIRSFEICVDDAL
jgi:hypothetical protein